MTPLPLQSPAAAELSSICPLLFTHSLVTRMQPLLVVHSGLVWRQKCYSPRLQTAPKISERCSFSHAVFLRCICLIYDWRISKGICWVRTQVGPHHPYILPHSPSPPVFLSYLYRWCCHISIPDPQSKFSTPTQHTHTHTYTASTCVAHGLMGNPQLIPGERKSAAPGMGLSPVSLYSLLLTFLLPSLSLPTGFVCRPAAPKTPTGD